MKYVVSGWSGPRIRSRTNKACVRISSGSMINSSNAWTVVTSLALSYANCEGKLNWRWAFSPLEITLTTSHRVIWLDTDLTCWWLFDRSTAVNISRWIRLVSWLGLTSLWTKQVENWLYLTYTRQITYHQRSYDYTNNGITITFISMALRQKFNAPRRSRFLSTKVAPNKCKESNFSCAEIRLEDIRYSTMSVWPVSAAAAAGVIPKVSFSNAAPETVNSEGGGSFRLNRPEQRQLDSTNFPLTIF